MALPNGSGGYQVGDGNLNDPLIDAIPEPVAIASAATLTPAGHAAEDVDRVLRLIRLSEYKRRQSAPGVRISQRAFGRDWRYPLTNGFLEKAL